jgi:hypothetical protein
MELTVNIMLHVASMTRWLVSPVLARIAVIRGMMPACSKRWRQLSATKRKYKRYDSTRASLT